MDTSLATELVDAWEIGLRYGYTCKFVELLQAIGVLPLRLGAMTEQEKWLLPTLRFLLHQPETIREGLSGRSLADRIAIVTAPRWQVRHDPWSGFVVACASEESQVQTWPFAYKRDVLQVAMRYGFSARYILLLQGLRVLPTDLAAMTDREKWLLRTLRVIIHHPEAVREALSCRSVTDRIRVVTTPRWQQ